MRAVGLKAHHLGCVHVDNWLSVEACVPVAHLYSPEIFHFSRSEFGFPVVRTWKSGPRWPVFTQRGVGGHAWSLSLKWCVWKFVSGVKRRRGTDGVRVIISRVIFSMSNQTHFFLDSWYTLVCSSSACRSVVVLLCLHYGALAEFQGARVTETMMGKWDEALVAVDWTWRSMKLVGKFSTRTVER